jgi:hypothetical protein
VSGAGTLEPREARAESWMPRPRESQLESSMLRGAQRVLARPVMGRRGGGRSDYLGGSLITCLCSRGGLIAWERDLTVSLCSRGGLTARERGLTTTSGQRWESWRNPGCW